MLSANAQAVSLKPDPLQSNGLDRAWRAFGRLIRRLIRCGPRMVPDLPDDLHCDVGFGERLPFDRESAYWEARQHSRARDLPF